MSDGTQATALDARPATSAPRANAPSGRVAALTAIAGIVFMAASGVIFSVAGGSGLQASEDPHIVVAAGATGANLFRVASLVDLFGYLLLAPVAHYLYCRFRTARFIELYTVAAFAYLLVGAIGAVMFAAAGPPLLREYVTASAAQREAITTTFTALYNVVVIGLWQTLEGLPGAVWLLGIGSILFQAQRRVAALLPFALGTLILAISVSRIVSL